MRDDEPLSHFPSADDLRRNAALDHLRRDIAHVQTSELLRTLLWLHGCGLGPIAEMPPLADRIRRQMNAADDLSEAARILYREVDLRIPVLRR